jgi:hypothetical protein
MAVENGEEVLGRRELVHGDGHHVVGDLAACILVQVVADPRAVPEEVLDGHVLRHQGEVVAEEGPRRRVEREVAVLDQADDGEGRHALHPTRNREVRVWAVRDVVRSIREAVRRLDEELAVAVHAYDPGERGRRRDSIEIVEGRPTHAEILGLARGPGG